MRIPEKSIDVVESGQQAMEGCLKAELERNITFNIGKLESFSLKCGEPLIYDAIIVAASIEYADRIVRRSQVGWARRLSIFIPVSEYDLWSSSDVTNALREAVEFLTGDYWDISFKRLRKPVLLNQQFPLELKMPVDSVVAFSDGMDSHLVAGIMGCDTDKKDRLALARVKSGNSSKSKRRNGQECFIPVMYSVKTRGHARESSFRSRGFRFAMISGIASYLTDAKRIIVPESGQGIFGPALISLGHMYPDYRNHPLFTKSMERFLEVLFRRPFLFDFPRIWKTKGETLQEFVALLGKSTWKDTSSCWKTNQWSSANGKYRQCGTCAACMLRRMSVHAAGFTEKTDTYICSNIKAPTLEAALAPGFLKFNKAFREYAIAGVLSMDNLSRLVGTEFSGLVQSHAVLLGPVFNISANEAEEKLTCLLNRHTEEWREYLTSLGPKSYIKKWIRRN